MINGAFNLEDVDRHVEQARTLAMIYYEFVGDVNWAEMSSAHTEELLERYMSIIKAILAELRDLSAGVKAGLKLEAELEELRRAERAVR